MLDEFDVLFFDKRGKPSDFVYKLLVLEDNLKKKNFLVCIITISNNVLSDYDLDDRVRSRIGSTDIFFNPYSKDEIINILSKRGKAALADGAVDDSVLHYCAEQSSLGHGDARRALDLLRVASEVASLDGGNRVLLQHIDAASDKLQKDRVVEVLASASYHMKLACFCIARLSYLTEDEWQTTSTIYLQYQKLVASNVKPLTYRRVSELLIDLQNTGLVQSHTSSKGRQGYGTQFKLINLPEVVGSLCFPDSWKEIVQRKEERKRHLKELSVTGTITVGEYHVKFNKKNSGSRLLLKEIDDKWNKFVGKD